MAGVIADGFAGHRHWNVRWRRAGWVAAVGATAIACCLALLAWSLAAPAAPAAPAAAGAPAAGAAPGTGTLGTRARSQIAASGNALAACELRLERAPDGLPVMAVVGASFTAGTGPGNAALSWAVLLARTLGWNAVVDGVPGAGYVRAGAGHQGPVARLLAREDLRALDPGLVVVQAGHDDSGVPASLERQRVGQVIDAIRAAAPRARIALLTVFAAQSGLDAALSLVNDAIIAAARAADPHVIVMNPLGGGWRFQRAARGGLHPSAAGDAWIAAKVAATLRAHGVAPAAGRGAVICDSAAGRGPRSPRLQ
jgi:lysophospholipase L1-like esterase